MASEWTGADRGITADDFLKLLTDGIVEEHESVILGTAFKGDKGTAFIAARWPETRAKRKTHVSISLQEPTQDSKKGKQTSRLVNWTGMWALVLDDVLEKAEAPDLLPTAIVETKPGSQQWWYVFDEPLRGNKGHFLGQELVRGAIAAGLSDPGMSNVIRWARLPGSQPPGKDYAARVIRWEPGLLFDPYALGEQLGLDMSSWDYWQDKGIEGDFSAIDLGEQLDDPVLDWMNGQGMILGNSGQGWLKVECPRAEEHSNDDRLAYYHPEHENRGRAFQCKHGHDGHPPTQEEFAAYLADAGAPMSVSFAAKQGATPRDLSALAAVVPAPAPVTRDEEVEEEGSEAPAPAPFDRAQEAIMGGNKAPNPRVATQPGLDDFVFSTETDCYINKDTGTSVTARVFNKMMWNLWGRGYFVAGEGKNSKVVTPEEAFIIDQHDMVAGERYRPDLDELIYDGTEDEEGGRYFNTYMTGPLPDPVDDPEVAQVLEDHMRDLLPEHWQIVLQWMAHNIQYPGRKIIWTPLLVGEEGDGKTTLGEILRAAMGGGVRHVGVVGKEALHSNFTKSLVGKSVVVLEEVLQMNDTGRQDKASLVEKLKPYQSNTWVPYVAKGRDEVMVRNVTNYIAMTNHADALDVKVTSRRWGVFATRYLHEPELTQERKLSGAFNTIYGLINDPAKRGAIRGWLMSIDITDFNPFADAPMTEAKRTMAGAAVPEAQQQVEDVIEDGAPGVWPDLLSTNKLAEELGKARDKPMNTRTLNSTLTKMGWIKVPDSIRPRFGGQRHRLYVRKHGVSSDDAAKVFLSRMEEMGALTTEEAIEKVGEAGSVTKLDDHRKPRK